MQSISLKPEDFRLLRDQSYDFLLVIINQVQKCEHINDWTGVYNLDTTSKSEVTLAVR